MKDQVRIVILLQLFVFTFCLYFDFLPTIEE